MFGVGGWGYAVFGELTFLSKLESRGKDTGFSILKPGQHLPKSAITRHSESESTATAFEQLGGVIVARVGVGPGGRSI